MTLPFPSLPPLPSPPGVYYISPNSGSFMGGTQISIVGINFSPDQFSFTNPLLGNKVMFHHDDYPSMECPVITYDTNPTQIVCTTPWVWCYGGALSTDLLWSSLILQSFLIGVHMYVIIFAMQLTTLKEWWGINVCPYVHMYVLHMRLWSVHLCVCVCGIWCLKCLILFW